MTIRECYQKLGGNFAQAETRLSSGKLVERFLAKFLDDGSFSELCIAMDQRDRNKAFRAAHTLKGIAQNLSFKRLGESSSSLTEFLRGKADGQIDASQCASLFGIVKEDYDAVVEAIQMLS